MGEAAAAEAYFPPTRPWSEEGGRVFLHASECRACGKFAFPPHKICPDCGSDDQAAKKLSPEGKLYTYSEIHVAPKGFKTPYAVGYVDLPEGVRVFGQIEQRAADLTIGQTVSVVLGAVRSEADGRPVISYRFRANS
jgi:uncharacterized OB-fold protein